MSGLDAPIYVRITVDGVRVELSLKRKINDTDWNPVQEKAKGTKNSAKGLNHFLRELETKIVPI